MGARVEIALHGENLVRSLAGQGEAPAPGAAAPDRSSGHPVALVQAEGLPNLLHELAHAVQAGCLADDHGIDYTAIPFDLGSAAGRAVLWDELSCCVTSCAYLRAHGRAARAGAPAGLVAAEVEAWFREQVEIQPVFYGLEHDPAAFVERVAALLRTHAAEAQAVLDRAYAALERALVAAGADPGVAAPPVRPSLPILWSLLSPGHSAGAADRAPSASQAASCDRTTASP
jgi:hypothetical protein